MTYSFLVLTSIADGLGNAVDHLDHIYMIFMGIVILTAAVLFLISLRVRSNGYKIFHGIMCVIFLAVCVLCFQHEIKAYKSGTALLIIAIFSLTSIFFRSKKIVK